MGRARADRLNELLSVTRPELDRVLAVIATLDPDQPPSEDRVVQAIDELARQCPDDADAAGVLDHLYGTVGLSGDLADYYDPANSMIHRVLARRRGIPLTLAAIAAEVARRRDIDLRPIGMPGHVLLGEGPDPKRWFDPFGRGAELGYDDCRLLFARFHAVEAFSPSMLRPMTADGVAVRTLNNLRNSYARRGQASRTIPVLELRASMDSAELGDRVELANLLAGLGRHQQAAEQYQQLAEEDPSRRQAYLQRARASRAHSN